MVVRALIVDDSAFFRRRIVELLSREPEIAVVGEAGNGLEALAAVARLRPDVITMDIHMPVMDGISAVRRIMRERPTPVLVFSSSTREGARTTLEALAAGAVDFLPKRWQEIAGSPEVGARALCRKLLALARGGAPQAPSVAATPRKPPALDGCALVAIGASTGGPMAVQRILTCLPATFPLPVLVVQHMPAEFTAAFAARLDALCRVRVKEAADGDALEPATAYIAPGGRQMRLGGRGRRAVLEIDERHDGSPYRPCVDITFASLAERFAQPVLAVVLTGMGADGREGARALKRRGARVWAQDEATSVVFGMPQAVIGAGLADAVLPLADIGPALARR